MNCWACFACSQAVSEARMKMSRFCQAYERAHVCKSATASTTRSCEKEGFAVIMDCAFQFLPCRCGMWLLTCHRAFSDVMHDALAGCTLTTVLSTSQGPIRPCTFVAAVKELYEWATQLYFSRNAFPTSVSRWTNNENMTLDEVRRNSHPAILS